MGKREDVSVNQMIKEVWPLTMRREHTQLVAKSLRLEVYGRRSLVMLPVDATMAVMCHVPFACCMLVHGSRCRYYCMFSRSVDTCRYPVMWMVAHYELRDDELALWHSCLSESHRII